MTPREGESTTPLLPGALAVEGTRVEGNTVTSTNGVSGGLLYAYLARTSPVVVTLASSTFVDNAVASARGVTRGGLFQLEEARRVAIMDSVLRANTITSGVDGGSTMNPGVVQGGLLYQASTRGFYGDPDPDGELTLVRTDVSRNRVGTSLATDAVNGGLFMLYVPWHATGHLFTFSSTNSTLSENVVQARSAVNGGLLNVFNRDGSDVLVDLSNATLALNQTKGPLGTSFGFGDPPTSPSSSYRAAVVRLRNTILTRNDAPGGADCPLRGPLSTTTSSGHNLLGDVTACAGMTPASSDLVGHEPLFGASGDHGGRVPSLPLTPESPAVDSGDPAGCVDATSVPLSTDQRGLPRPSGARCDIGAFELQLP